MSMDIQEVINREVTWEQYKQAVEIYLKHAFPDNEPTRKGKLNLLKNPHFWVDGIPKESRLGCYANGNMKLRCGFLDTENYKATAGFWVSRNDLNCDPVSRAWCKEVQRNIEEAWKDAGLPVKPHSVNSAGGSE